jgi:hypothetical protein
MIRCIFAVLFGHGNASTVAAERITEDFFAGLVTGLANRTKSYKPLQGSYRLCALSLRP